MWADRPARSAKVLASLSFVFLATQCTWLMGDLPDPIENVEGESGGGGEAAIFGGRDAGATAGSAPVHDGGAGGAQPAMGGTAGVGATGGAGEGTGGAGSDESGGMSGS